MKIDLIFLIVISIVIAYLFMLYKIDCNADKIEKMTDTTTETQIKELIKQVYQADVEAIRNLSNVSTQLQAGGLAVPGQLNVRDNINVSNKTQEGGRLRVLNELKNGKANQTNDWSIWNMTGIYGNKLSFWRYNGDGTGPGPALDLYDNGTVDIPGNLTVQTGTSNGDFKINGKLLTPAGHTIESVGRQHMTGSDNLYLLHKNGVIIGKDWGGNGNLYVGGDTNIAGNLNVGGRNILAELNRLNARFPDNNTLDLTGGQIIQAGPTFFHFTGPNGKGSKRIATDGCYCEWRGF